MIKYEQTPTKNKYATNAVATVSTISAVAYFHDVASKSLLTDISATV